MSRALETRFQNLGALLRDISGRGKSLQFGAIFDNLYDFDREYLRNATRCRLSKAALQTVISPEHGDAVSNIRCTNGEKWDREFYWFCPVCIVVPAARQHAAWHSCCDAANWAQRTWNLSNHPNDFCTCSWWRGATWHISNINQPAYSRTDLKMHNRQS